MHVEPEGAAQVVLLGPPNAGKSSLLAALTHARPTIADYPFATTKPQPGMMRFEDVQIQLVDLPPIAPEHMDPWLPNVVQTSDAAVLLADPSNPDTLAGIELIRERMAAVHLPLVGELPEDADPREMPLPTLLVLTKADLVGSGDLEVLEELYGPTFRSVRFSATKHIGHQQFRIELWRLLQLIRVYTKPPGKKAERSDPFVLHVGSTVHDLADRIHADLAEKLAVRTGLGWQDRGAASGPRLRAARPRRRRTGDLIRLPAGESGVLDSRSALRSEGPSLLVFFLLLSLGCAQRIPRSVLGEASQRPSAITSAPGAYARHAPSRQPGRTGPW